MKKLKIKLASWLLYIANKLHRVPITRDTVLADAKKISLGAVVLYTDNERWQFAFRMFIDRGVFSQKETDRFVKRAERVRRKRK